MEDARRWSKSKDETKTDVPGWGMGWYCVQHWGRGTGGERFYEGFGLSISFKDSGSELVWENWVTGTETLILRFGLASALRHVLTLSPGCPQTPKQSSCLSLPNVEVLGRHHWAHLKLRYSTVLLGKPMNSSSLRVLNYLSRLCWVRSLRLDVVSIQMLSWDLTFLKD